MVPLYPFNVSSSFAIVSVKGTSDFMLLFAGRFMVVLGNLADEFKVLVYKHFYFFFLNRKQCKHSKVIFLTKKTTELPCLHFLSGLWDIPHACIFLSQRSLAAVVVSSVHWLQNVAGEMRLIPQRYNCSHFWWREVLAFSSKNHLWKLRWNITFYVPNFLSTIYLLTLCVFHMLVGFFSCFFFFFTLVQIAELCFYHCV